MKNYTEEEKILIGEVVAKTLMMKKDRDYKDRYQTLLGNKTALGIFGTITRIAESIKTGDLEWLLKNFKQV